MKRAGLIASWGVLAALMSIVAYQIVAAAESQVSERALTPIVAIATETTGVTIAVATTTTSVTTTTTSTAPKTTQTTAGTTTTTTTAAPSTIPPSTTVATAWSRKTIPSAGGDVVIEYRPDQVRFVAVSRLASGYKVEVGSAGPPSVEVTFEGDEGRISVKARWENGRLDVRIETEED